MSEGSVEYQAFQSAALTSEVNRIFGVLWVLGALMVGVIIRNIEAGQLRLLYVQTIALAIAVTYEALALAIVKKSLRLKRDIPPAFLPINIIVETGLPTLGLFILIDSRFTTPSEALVAPAVFLYFLFIILSTLRLSPYLALLSGLMSALSYLGAAFYVHQRYPDLKEGAAALPLIYFIYAGLIAAGGIVAAAVAAQIRDHVNAALRKAELQRQLELVNHDLDMARSIQQGLFPSRSPTLRGFEVAGWNQPAEQTGGDYFDWQMLPDGRLAVSIGDATGHGIGPALVTASCRAYARASLLSRELDCLLNTLNRLLAEDLPPNQFVTFAVVFLDPARSCVEVLSAGHGPILWYKRATDKIENIEAQGIPLGMIAAATYGHGTQACMASGDMLALITDGFYEWENHKGEEFGLERLKDVIRASSDCSAEEVIARLRSAVANFCDGTKQKDDLTAVILKAKAEAPA